MIATTGRNAIFLDISTAFYPFIFRLYLHPQIQPDMTLFLYGNEDAFDSLARQSKGIFICKMQILLASGEKGRSGSGKKGQLVVG